MIDRWEILKNLHSYADSAMSIRRILRRQFWYTRVHIMIVFIPEAAYFFPGYFYTSWYILSFVRFRFAMAQLPYLLPGSPLLQHDTAIETMATAYNQVGSLIHDEDEMEGLRRRQSRFALTRSRHHVAGILLALTFFIASATHLVLRLGGGARHRHRQNRRGRYPDRHHVSIETVLADQHASSDAPLEQQEPNKDVSLEHANQNVSPDSAVAHGETLHHKTPIDEPNNSSLGSTDMTAAMHHDDDDGSDQIINVTKALEPPGQVWAM